MGRRLLVDLIEASLAQGYSSLSLSVIEENPARDSYESVGFVLVEKHGRSWTMVRHSAQEPDAWVHNLIHAFNAHDADAVGRLVTDDVVYSYWFDSAWTSLEGVSRSSLLFAVSTKSGRRTLCLA